MAGMLTNVPISLYDGNGGYTRYIHDTVVPNLLRVIEESGLSFEDAKSIPQALASSIEESILKMNSTTRFKAGSLYVPDSLNAQ